MVNDYSIFQQLLSPQVLNHVAPPPGGEIFVRHLHALPGYQCTALDSDKERESGWKQQEPYEFPLTNFCRVLNVGCGNSQLGEYMLQSGFTDVVNVDYSEIVIKKSECNFVEMSPETVFAVTHAEWAIIHGSAVEEKYNDEYFAELSIRQERKELHCDTPKLESRDDGSSLSTTRPHPIPKMTFYVGDVTEGLDFPNESFDLIICKKTLDVILCGVGSVTNAKSMMTECFRLLNKEHGVMMILSSAKPEDRAYYFEQDPWSGVENIKLPSMEIEQRKSHERYVDADSN